MRRTGLLIALAAVAALYVWQVQRPSQPAAPLDARRLASDEPAPPDSGSRPSVRPLDALFLYAEVMREADAGPPPGDDGGAASPGPILRLMATNHAVPIDAERSGEARLRELGLASDVLDAGAAPPHRVSFEPRAPGAPGGHDGLLRALAGLAGADLAGVEFIERAPAGPAGDYELTAVSGESRGLVRTAALNFGQWYDLDAVLGLLNTLLEDRGSESRFVVLATNDRLATVLVGPAAGIQAAAAEGLIEVGEASFPMNAGRVEDEKADAGSAGPAPSP